MQIICTNAVSDQFEEIWLSKVMLIYSFALAHLFRVKQKPVKARRFPVI